MNSTARHRLHSPHLVALCLIAAAAPVAAQEIPRLPTTVLPDVRLQEVTPRPQPGPGADITVPQTAPTRAPAGTDEIRFLLTDLQIEGATAYRPEDLQALYGEMVGREVTLAEIYAAAERLQRKYREDGYFLARVIVPAQTVRDGAFRLQVIEGWVNQIEIDGDVGPVEDLVRRYLARVTEERPLTLAGLERALLLVNDIPGVTATGLLRPSPDEPGAAQLVVTVARKPVDGFLLVDNFGNEFTGLWQAAGSATANAFTPVGERVTVTGLVSDPFDDWTQKRNQWVTQIDAAWKMGADGLFGEALFSYGVSHPGYIVRDFDFDSKTLLASGTVGYPFVRTRDLSVYGRVGFDYIDSDTDIFGGDKFSRDKLRILHFGVVADYRDAWRGASTVSAGLRQGLPFLDATERGDEFKSRPDATAEETVLVASASRLQSLIDGISLLNAPANLNVFASLGGQYGFDSLLSYEEFELGGTRWGRGYDLGELSGDSGLGLTGELQFNHKPDIPYLDGWQAFGFLDYGRVWNDDVGPDNDLMSVGAGLRTSLLQHLSLEALFAKPLLLDSERSNNGKDPVFLFRAVGRL